MKKVYLITVPNDVPGGKPEMFVVDDISVITGKYSLFMIQQIDYISE